VIELLIAGSIHKGRNLKDVAFGVDRLCRKLVNSMASGVNRAAYLKVNGQSVGNLIVIDGRNLSVSRDAVFCAVPALVLTRSAIPALSALSKRYSRVFLCDLSRPQWSLQLPCQSLLLHLDRIARCRLLSGLGSQSH
jgi:hypothetical protein